MAGATGRALECGAFGSAATGRARRGGREGGDHGRPGAAWRRVRRSGDAYDEDICSAGGGLGYEGGDGEDLGLRSGGMDELLTIHS